MYLLEPYCDTFHFSYISKFKKKKCTCDFLKQKKLLKTNYGEALKNYSQ